MKPLATMIIAVALSACTHTGPGVRVQTEALPGTENQFLARGPGGAWADAAPLAGLQASAAANCATTSKGTACVLQGTGTEPNRSLATAREGRCLANWGQQGTGTGIAIVELHRNAFPTSNEPLRERLYYALNSGSPLDVASRLSEPAAFTRLCDQLIQPDRLVRRVRD